LFFWALSDPGRELAASPDETFDRLRAAVDRVARSHGLELFDVQWRREPIGWVLRVIIDRPEGAAAVAAGGAGTEGVGVEDCQVVSQDLGALLDVEDDLGPSAERGYTLEVSSPGLDRPLRGEADYRRFTGRLAKIVTKEPVEGQSHFAGRLSGIEDGVVLVTQGRRVHRVPLTLISRANLDVEF
jgi:ribosome maturation factor RimP